MLKKIIIFAVIIIVISSTGLILYTQEKKKQTVSVKAAEIVVPTNKPSPTIILTPTNFPTPTTNPYTVILQQQLQQQLVTINTEIDQQTKNVAYYKQQEVNATTLFNAELKNWDGATDGSPSVLAITYNNSMDDLDQKISDASNKIDSLNAEKINVLSQLTGN